MHRNSKKRNAILECLRQTDSHPNAEWIYARLKPTFPDLSLATVYRNMRMLQQEGVIDSLGAVCGQERFDGDTAPHSHGVCRVCGRVFDLPPAVLSEEWLRDAARRTGFSLSASAVQLSGVCRECSAKEVNL